MSHKNPADNTPSAAINPEGRDAEAATRRGLSIPMLSSDQPPASPSTPLDARLGKDRRNVPSYAGFSAFLWVPKTGWGVKTCQRTACHCPHVVIDDTELAETPFEEVFTNEAVVEKIMVALKEGRIICCMGRDQDGNPGVLVEGALPFSQAVRVASAQNTRAIALLVPQHSGVEAILARAQGKLMTQEARFAHPVSRAVGAVLSNYERIAILFILRLRSNQLVTVDDVYDWGSSAADLFARDPVNQ